MIKILRIPAPLFLLITLAIFGCKSNSTSPSDPSPTIPTPGSTFSTVWNGGYTITAYDTVDATSLTDSAHSGSRVIKLIETVNGQDDSTFESFESNGDLAVMGTSWGAVGSFETLPFGSQSPVNSSYIGSAGLVTISAIGNGSGKPFLLNGTEYPTDSVTVSVITSNDTDRFPYSYIPALGLICIQNYIPGSSSGQPTTQMLTAYTPK